MNNLIISHMTLRKSIGILGIALAFITVLGGLIFSGETASSISGYYYTNMRDIFVATLMISGAFLLSYKGYSKLDNISSNIAGVSGIFIALFPCIGGVSPVSFMQISSTLSNVIHLASASIFFSTIAFISYFLFTKGSDIPTKEKLKRNKVYKTSGLIMFGSILLILVAGLIVPGWLLNSIYFTLIMESIMLVAFGISWLVKGEAILKDII